MVLDWETIAAGDLHVGLDPEHGVIHDFTVNGRQILRESVFSFQDGPTGSSADVGEWQALTRAANASTAVLKLALEGGLRGADVTKEIWLDASQSALYQTHTLTGGVGEIALAQRSVLAPGEGATICFSEGQDLSSGRCLDWTGAGFQPSVAVNDAHARLGWTCVSRPTFGDIIVILKNARVAPVTRVKSSDDGFLCVDDGCLSPAGPEGVRQDLLPLEPNTRYTVRHAVLAVPNTESWRSVDQIALGVDHLTLATSTGDVVKVPFNARFFVF